MILEFSNPASLTAVDTIFRDAKSESDAAALLAKYLLEYKKFFLAQLDSGEEKAYQSVLKLEERLKVLSDFSRTPEIGYLPSFTQKHLGKMDIIFINFFLYHIQDPQDFIINLRKYLSPSGKIIIVDFDTLRRSFSSKILHTLHIEKSLFS